MDRNIPDVDWEYPGGNGDDYRQNPNSGKVDEITGFPLLLQEIKTGRQATIRLFDPAFKEVFSLHIQSSSPSMGVWDCQSLFSFTFT